MVSAFFLKILRKSHNLVKVCISKTDSGGVFSLRLKRGVTDVSDLPRILFCSNNYEALYIVTYLAIMHNLIEYEELLTPCYVAAFLNQHTYPVDAPRSRRSSVQKVPLKDVTSHICKTRWYAELSRKKRANLRPRKVQRYLMYDRLQTEFKVDNPITERLLERLGFRQRNKGVGPHFVNRKLIAVDWF